MSEVAFYYRLQRDTEPLPVMKGGTVVLEENAAYVISSEEPFQDADLTDLKQRGYEAITDTAGLLKFSNFVGTAWLAGAWLQVNSTKLGSGGVAALLQEVSRLSSGLVYGWNSPTRFRSAESDEHQLPIAFHQFQLLREVILHLKPGERLLDHFGSVERNATQRFAAERPVVPVTRAKGLDTRALVDIFRHPERLVPVLDGQHFAGAGLTFASHARDSSVHYYPERLSVPARALSFDTAENRFVKHFLGECLDIVYQILDLKTLRTEIRADARQMATMLEISSSAFFLRDVTRLNSFSEPSQALVKAQGYRDLFKLWLDLKSYRALPTSGVEVERMLQGQDVALLYEYWVFLKVVEATQHATGIEVRQVRVRRNALGETLQRGLQVIFNDTLSVTFNGAYSRTLRTAYSTLLRPDVILKIGEREYAFDAKYRLQIDRSLKDDSSKSSRHVPADLYKMHAYRDAILGIKAAFVVYPGTRFIFFARSGEVSEAHADMVSDDGVGAIPARPEGAEPGALKSVVTYLLESAPPSA